MTVKLTTDDVLTVTARLAERINKIERENPEPENAEEEHALVVQFAGGILHMDREDLESAMSFLSVAATTTSPEATTIGALLLGFELRNLYEERLMETGAKV